MHILIDDSTLDIVEELNKKYKEVWQKEVDYTVVPRGLTQEKLVLCLKLMIEENLSLLMAYNKLFKK